MTPGRIAIGIGGLGVGAAWLATRLPAFAPLLWVGLLVGILALQPAARRLLAPWQLGLGTLLVVVSWLVALDHELALRHALLLLAGLLVVGLARQFPLSDTGVLLCCGAIAATALVALLQSTGGLDEARAGIGALPPALREAAATRLDVGRVFGTAALPGHFAALLLMVAPPLVAALGASRRWMRVAAMAGLALVGAGVLLTRSLAASVVAATVLTVALTRGRRRPGLALGVSVALLVVTLATLLWRTDLGTLEPVRLRWQNWRVAVSAFADHPWLGVGLGGVGQAALASPAGEGNLTTYAHCLPLQLLAEVGLAGVPALALAVLWLGRVVRRGLVSDLPLTLAVLVIPLHNLVDFSLYTPEVALPWAVLAGTLASRVEPLPARPTPAWLLVPVLAAGTFLATLQWRGETGMARALAGPEADRLEQLVSAAAWTPWSLTPWLTAAQTALESQASPAVLEAIDEGLAGCAWVRPRSGTWAESRARLLLALSRQGEALVWVRETRRRTPWRAGLDELELQCRAR
ncbi:MAG: O-antigen ligase family protein [Thermoanaerobaculaceae bacterium]|nr:O-antigen ligase family protein [Thermoanaerobaculaceae bacterium]